jgi:hypothetical protein
LHNQFEDLTLFFYSDILVLPYSIYIEAVKHLMRFFNFEHWITYRMQGYTVLVFIKIISIHILSIFAFKQEFQ